MKPEIIIVAAVGLIGLYIFIQLSITNSKMKSKTKPSKQEEKVELKTVVAPKQDTAALEEQLLREQEQEMRRAALESIEDERRWKESIQKAQELKLEEKKQEEQSALDKKLKQMQAKLDSLDFSVEEQSFIDEVNRLSPQLKAVLFADLIKRKTDF